MGVNRLTYGQSRSVQTQRYTAAMEREGDAERQSRERKVDLEREKEREETW